MDVMAEKTEVDFVEEADPLFDAELASILEKIEKQNVGKHQPPKEAPEDWICTVLGFRMNGEVVLIGDTYFIVSKNQIVVGITGTWQSCCKIFDYLKWLIPKNDQMSAKYYAVKAVRYIRTLKNQRREHAQVLVGGFHCDAPTNPQLWRANKLGVSSVVEALCIGAYELYATHAIKEGRFRRDMSTKEVLAIGEQARAKINDATTSNSRKPYFNLILKPPNKGSSDNSQLPRKCTVNLTEKLASP